MISVLLFMDLKGQILVQRHYRDDIRKQTIDAFRQSIATATNAKEPVVSLDGCSFMYARVNNIYICAVTRVNSNPTLVFQFIYKLVDVFEAYFEQVEEATVREHFVLIYELLDECMDNGYPQLTAPNLLAEVVKVGKQKETTTMEVTTESGITSEITGAKDWRQPGKYFYEKNEIYIDILEAVNVLVNKEGAILKADVGGKIMMRSQLSGMPECMFGLNDKVSMDHESKKSRKKFRSKGITIDDVVFHRSVKLNQFDNDRTISFTPPDGQFELMKYRITRNAVLPFKVIPVVTEHGRHRVEYEIKVKATFPYELFAEDVIVRIPLPPNTGKVKFMVGMGKWKRHKQKNCVFWKIKRFPGQASFMLKGQAILAHSIMEKQWVRPPLQMEFGVEMFAASGLHVRFLRVFERSNYHTSKWVRYVTRAGQYQIRI